MMEDSGLNLRAEEKRLIIKALDRTKNVKKEAAKLLGVHRKTLYNKMIECDIPVGSVKRKFIVRSHNTK